jgi:ubiquinone/menaquinone biosynthesis C-methylase UbiE
MAQRAGNGSVVGIDVSDEMVRLARDESSECPNLQFQVASAEQLPFGDQEFTHVFSMESLYYYADMERALGEIRRVLEPGGLFVAVVDLYRENEPSHQWIDSLNVPVQLLSGSEYCSRLESAGFVNVSHERVLDPSPLPEIYSGTTFKTREDFVQYRKNGSLMLIAEAPR